MTTQSVQQDSIPCPKCGQLNSARRSQCENCKAPLEQLKEAGAAKPSSRKNMKGCLLRQVPIIAALASCGIVAVIGILLTPAGVYAKDVNASPGTAIGAVALIVSVIVLFVTKKIVESKIN